MQISLHDARGRYVWCHPDAPELIGKFPWTLAAPSERHIIRAAFMAAIVDGEPTHYDYGQDRLRAKLYPCEVAHVAVVCVHTSGPSLSLSSLTKRQRQIFDLVRRGLSNKAIAKQMGISVATLHNHRSAMTAKLGPPSTWHTITT